MDRILRLVPSLTVAMILSGHLVQRIGYCAPNRAHALSELIHSVAAINREIELMRRIAQNHTGGEADL